jgi:TfoX/Sxy family transcriptional regulator of competence genes
MTAEERFAAISDALLCDPAITHKKMFGSMGLSVGGKVFAMLVKGRLVVKLPAARVDDLLASGAGERFDPGHGRLMKEWASVGPQAEWPKLVEEARAFVEARL